MFEVFTEYLEVGIQCLDVVIECLEVLIECLGTCPKRYRSRNECLELANFYIFTSYTIPTPIEVVKRVI